MQKRSAVGEYRKYRSTQNEIKRLEKENAELKDEQGVWHESIEVIQKLEAENTKLKSECQRLKSTFTDLPITEKWSPKISIDRHTCDVSDLEAENTRLMQDLSDLRQKNIELGMELEKARLAEVCIWTYDDNYDYWETSCGEAFTIIDGTLEENKMKYCSFCGKAIKQSCEEGLLSRNVEEKKMENKPKANKEA